MRYIVSETKDGQRICIPIEGAVFLEQDVGHHRKEVVVIFVQSHRIVLKESFEQIQQKIRAARGDAPWPEKK